MGILSYKVARNRPELVEDIWQPKLSSLGLWANLPTMFLAYAFQSHYFTVYESLKLKTDSNGMKATILSILVCIIIYVTVGIVGLIAYGENLKGDIMQNISEEADKPVSNYILMSMFLVIAAMHIPIVFFIGKQAVLIMLDEHLR